MASFRYKARDVHGAVVEGQLEAASAAAVAEQLFGSGITPVDITEVRTKVAAGAREIHWLERPIQADDLIMFSRQMYTLIKAGVPIIRAMNGLVETSRNLKLKRVLKAVAESLESGRGLAESLRQHPGVFTNLYVSMIAVGENSGQLEESFLQIARHLELDKETRDRVKAALRYPIMVIATIAIAIGVINVYVIPAFSQVFASFKAELPWATQLLLGTSAFTVAYWPHILALLVAAVLGLRAYVRTEKGELRWDEYKLRLPVVGNLIRRATLARFARSFAMAVRSGVPLIQALTVVSRAVDNAFVGQHLRGMRLGIERGESLTRTAANTNLFTPLVMQMLLVGEETGQVDTMMQEVAEFYEREVDYDLKSLSSYIEPILIVFVGIMVLILALGVFLPMWDLASAAKG
jgi:MSHA biogenesis protein MshG